MKQPKGFIDGVVLPNTTTYCHMVEALQYFTITRPDVALAVNICIIFVSEYASTFLYSLDCCKNDPLLSKRLRGTRALLYHRHLEPLNLL